MVAKDRFGLLGTAGKVLQQENLRGQGERQPLEVLRAPARQAGDGFVDFDRISGQPSLGWFMSVSRAVVRTPILAPVATIDWASIRAECLVFMKAPEPNFTSSTSAERFSASFLLRAA